MLFGFVTKVLLFYSSIGVEITLITNYNFDCIRVTGSFHRVYVIWYTLERWWCVDSVNYNNSVSAMVKILVHLSCCRITTSVPNIKFYFLWFPVLPPSWHIDNLVLILYSYGGLLVFKRIENVLMDDSRLSNRWVADQDDLPFWHHIGGVNDFLFFLVLRASKAHIYLTY